LMWWKRRPRGGTGLPARASDATVRATPRRLTVTVGVAAVGLGIVFPVFGASLLLVLAVEVILSARRGAATPDHHAEPDAPVDAADLPAGALESAARPD
jgi:uncharacterized iron-regulated membrane protein